MFSNIAIALIYLTTIYDMLEDYFNSLLLTLIKLNSIFIVTFTMHNVQLPRQLN
jgi:hypothetical protein